MPILETQVAHALFFRAEAKRALIHPRVVHEKHADVTRMFVEAAGSAIRALGHCDYRKRTSTWARRRRSFSHFCFAFSSFSV